MAFFGNTFREKITDELERRRNFDDVQDVLVPHVRVTSMVQTTDFNRIEGFPDLSGIKGFTLGPHDLVSNTTLDSLSNINNTGCVIGTTYINGKAEPVTIPTHKNLPSPGVTNVSIETKGGLMFKATINIKFYGKEQYDAIYQLFMKPGRVVVIEFGHTNTNKKDLEFFTTLDDDQIEKFRADLREFKPTIPENPNSGVAVGQVSNFKISLNEQNEYEASIDLVNGLEFMFTLPVDETVLDFRENGLSKSIKDNFGMNTGMEYSAKYDCVYKTIFNDHNNQEYKKDIMLPKNDEIGQINWSEILRDENQTEIIGSLGLQIKNFNREQQFVFVGLDYLFSVLIPKILGSTGENINGILRKNSDNFVPLIEYGPIGNWSLLRSNNIKNVLINNVNLYEGLEDQPTFPKAFNSRVEDYEKRFELPRDIVENEFFTVRGRFGPQGSDQKYSYPISNEDTKPERFDYESADGGVPVNILSGIFVSYNTIKNAFTNANSLSEAIIKILNQINAATSDILKLKLQVVRDVPEGQENEDVPEEQENEVGEVEKLVIYDERASFIPENDNIFNFFEKNNQSEAISYKFDFSLPSSVASTVVANSWKGNDDSEESIGDSEVIHIIRNGYVRGIDDMNQFLPVQSSDSTTDNNDNKKLTCDLVEVQKNDTTPRRSVRQGAGPGNNYTNVYDQRRRQQQEKEIEEAKQQVVDQFQDKLFISYLGYQEMVPSGLKKSLIRDGNNKLYDTLPTGAKVTLTLQGLDGFRFGDLFKVNNVLPYPYSNNALFYLTSYSHNITPEGWTTTINGQYITITPEAQNQNIREQNVLRSRTVYWDTSIPEFQTYTESLIADTVNIKHGPLKVDDRLLEVVEQVREQVALMPSPSGTGRLRLQVISGFRNSERNVTAGGRPSSAHLTGDAIDFQLWEWTSSNRDPRVRILKKPISRVATNSYGNVCIAAYTTVGAMFKEVGLQQGVTIRWGGEFKSLYDPNHVDIAFSDRLINGIRIGER